MPTLKVFFDAATSILSLGASTNAACRREIRDVTGKLADELDRALSLADSYLAGVRDPRDDAALVGYLRDAGGALRTLLGENDVCGALYHLADRFAQVFDPTRFSVSVTSHHEIPELIDKLRDGERAVIDDLEEMVGSLRDLAHDLDSAAPEDVKPVRNRILAAVQAHRAEVKAQRAQIKAMRRRIVDAL